jgi:hypothetical protein
MQKITGHPRAQVEELGGGCRIVEEQRTAAGLDAS